MKEKIIATTEGIEKTLQAIQNGDVDSIVVKSPQGDLTYSRLGQDHAYVFIQEMGEAALVVSKEGKILYANPMFSKMLFNDHEKVLGASLLHFVKEDEHQDLIKCLRKEGKNRSNFHLITKTGKSLTVSITSFKETWEGNEVVFLILTDVTELHQTKQLIEASSFIIKILSESPTLYIALKRMIQVLQNVLGWEAVFLWIWNQEKDRLICVESAWIPDLHIEEFAKSSKELESKEMRVPNHVWSTYRPVWIEDVTEDPTFVRRKEARKEGLHGALAFPLYQESKLMGVVELFRRNPFKEEIDEPLLDLMTTIGIELGLFLQRKITEERSLKYFSIVAQSPHAVFTATLDGTIKDWNPSAAKIYGWTAQEMIGDNIKKTIPPEKIPEFEMIRDTLIRGKTIEHFQTQRLHKNGSLIWVDIFGSPITDRFGTTIEASFIIKDISDQKAAFELVRENGERFQAFVEITGDIVWETDENGTFTFSNAAAHPILGYPPEVVIGKSLVDFSFPEDREKAQKLIEYTVKQKHSWSGQILRFRHKDGSERWLECSVSLILDANGKLKGARGVARDITAVKEVEKVKNEFISMISHELRTPLTSIVGALKLLTTKTFGPQEQKELLKTAERNSDKLMHIINDIIDVEKLQLGKFEFIFAKMNLWDAINEAIKSSEIIACKQHVKIQMPEVTTDAEIKGDYQRLIQVMMNLLSNAIKFSPENGTISVSLQLTETHVIVSVSDQGPGIPKFFQSKIFQPFAQADSSAKRPYPGTGLGLSICKNIIEGHGGSIEFITDEGKGTTFIFKLPRYQEKP